MWDINIFLFIMNIKDSLSFINENGHVGPRNFYEASMIYHFYLKDIEKQSVRILGVLNLKLIT